MRGRKKTVSLFFPPAAPSTTPTHGHFVLSPVSLALWEPHLHLRSHGKIGDCEQSTLLVDCRLLTSQSSLFNHSTNHLRVSQGSVGGGEGVAETFHKTTLYPHPLELLTFRQKYRLTFDCISLKKNCEDILIFCESLALTQGPIKKVL